LREDDDRLFADAVGLGCALDSFVEAQEAAEWIEQLAGVAAQGHYAVEGHRQKFVTVLDRYQEQPHLLDPHLPQMLAALLRLMRTAEEAGTEHAAAAFAAHLAKVRKAKVVARHFPHEVADVEPVLRMLERQDPHDGNQWETHYVLLLWMSVLALIPFDLARFDSGQKDEGQKVMRRILEVTKVYLGTMNKTQDAAALLAAKFLTRPEVQKIYLADFFKWVSQCASPANKSEPIRLGALKALAAIFKQGKRDDLLPHASVLLKSIVALDFKSSPNVLLRKMSLKVIQRLGLTFLKTKVAAWRYQRGKRSLALNLEPALSNNEDEKEDGVQEKDDDGYDIPDEIEDVVEELLCGLKDKETIIRWSAAKGEPECGRRQGHHLLFRRWTRDGPLASRVGGRRGGLLTAVVLLERD